MTKLVINTQIGPVKCIISRIIPPRGYIAMALSKIVFFRGTKNIIIDYLATTYGRQCLNHEVIHLIQEKELGFLKFLYLYVYSYLVLRIKYKMNHKDAYHNIPFEKEAVLNASNFEYKVSYWRDYDFYNIFKKS